MEMRLISRRGSLSSKYVEFCRFTLLFCRGRPAWCTKIYNARAGLLLCWLNLLFDGVLVAIANVLYFFTPSRPTRLFIGYRVITTTTPTTTTTTALSYLYLHLKCSLTFLQPWVLAIEQELVVTLLGKKAHELKKYPLLLFFFLILRQNSC